MLVKGEVKQVPELAALDNVGGRITKEIVTQFQSAYISQNRGTVQFTEVLETNPLLGQRNVVGGILPDFYLIPAVRDLGDETKTTSSAAFSRLLQRAVLEMTANNPTFVQLQNDLDSLVDQLNQRSPDLAEQPSNELIKLEQNIQAELESWGVGVSIRVLSPEVRRVLELGTELMIDDGHETVAERKGHGLQRAIIFSLVKAWSSVVRTSSTAGTQRTRAASESLVFAIEEPELYLHPHAQRELADALRLLSEPADHQVLICTHSTHFVDLANYESIGIINRLETNEGQESSNAKVTSSMVRVIGTENVDFRWQIGSTLIVVSCSSQRKLC